MIIIHWLNQWDQSVKTEKLLDTSVGDRISVPVGALFMRLEVIPDDKG